MLNALKRLPNPTVEVLQETRAGHTLQKIKKLFSSSTPAGLAAKELISSWKEAAAAQKTVENDQSTDDKRRSTRVPKPVISYTEEVEVKKAKEIKTKSSGIVIYPERQPLPSRNSDNEFVFPDYPAFRPNLSPKEVLQAGDSIRILPFRLL